MKYRIYYVFMKTLLMSEIKKNHFQNHVEELKISVNIEKCSVI